MNPFLELPEIWHQVHNRLIVAIADELTPQIVPEYRVSIEERIYTAPAETLLVGITDVAVTNRDGAKLKSIVATPTLTPPIKVSVPIPEEVTERYLEVRSTKTNAVISVIEILSPKNKRSGTGREAYESKRHQILGSKTNFVEIDLLRTGEPMLVLGVDSTGYRILVSRGNKRPEADLYSFGLRDLIPVFPVPLKGEPEPIVDLQKLLNEVYERARFDLAIDYSKPLKFALSAEEDVWVRSILTLRH
jgi:hypothetical protein